MNILWDKLAAELLRNMRGKRSRPALARRLQTDPNVIYMWETGARAPRTSVLFQMAAATRVDIGRLKSFLAPAAMAFARPDRWGAKEIASLLAVVTKGATAMEIARTTGTDRSTVARWRVGGAATANPGFRSFYKSSMRSHTDLSIG